MTATLRPELVDRTLDSFQQNMTNFDMKSSTLYINVDPAPSNSSIKPREVVDVARKYFGVVLENIPEQPNFCSAIKWLWDQGDGYILHFEDDWELFLTVDLQVMLAIIQDKNLYQLRLTKYLKKSATKKYGLSPCLVDPLFRQIVSQNLDRTMNPERQLLNVHQWGLKNHCSETIEAYPKGQIVIRDIGREWREDRGLNKHVDENHFITWNKQ